MKVCLNRHYKISIKMSENVTRALYLRASIFSHIKPESSHASKNRLWIHVITTSVRHF